MVRADHADSSSEASGGRVPERETELANDVAPRAMTVAVVLEWENMTFAEQARPRQAVAALKAQAAELYVPPSEAPPTDGRPVYLAAPLEIILCHDDDVSDDAFAESVADLLIDTASAHTRHLGVPDGSYLRQKNAGAAAAQSEIVVFLDSDVTPEPNWLSAFMQAFTAPDVLVAVGNTYVDASRGDAYSRAMALSWMFPLRDEEGGLRESTWFYGNNLAFRRDVILKHPFPDTPGLKHHGASVQVQRLAEAGIRIWHVGDARGHHPPPNGPAHFVNRAVAAGRMRALTAEPITPAKALEWARQDAAEVGYHCRRIVRDGSKVALRWWQVPAAMAYTTAYYGLRFSGAMATWLSPGFMRDRFDL